MYLNPYADLGFLVLNVVPGAIDWGLVKSVDVYVRYEDLGVHRHEQLFTLRPGSGEETWMVPVSHPTQRDVVFHTVNHLRDGSRRESPVATTRRSTLVIDDAFQAALNLDFVPLYDSAQIRTVHADIHYEDSANEYVRDERLSFDGESPPRQQLRLALFNGRITTYTLTYVIIGMDNSLRRLPAVVSDATLVFVGETFNQVAKHNARLR